MKILTTAHSTILSYDKNSNVLYNGRDSNAYVIYNIINNKISLSYSNKYIHIKDNVCFLDNKEIFYDIKYAENDKILIKIHDLFLSAQNNSHIVFMPSNRAWERFTVQKEDYIDIFSIAFKKYKEKRNNDKLILVCCSGNLIYNENFFCTDLNADTTRDTYYLDITKKFNLPDNCLDFIFIEHGLEHVDIFGVINFISESYRVLKPNGVLRIASPSLDNWIKYYIINDDNTDFITTHSYNTFIDKNINLSFKSKALVLNNIMRNWGHTLILDYVTYKNILLDKCFKHVYQGQIHYSKFDLLNNIEIRNDRYNDLETLIIEAIK